VPDLDRRERGKQIEIADGGRWYAAKAAALVDGLLKREQEALETDGTSCSAFGIERADSGCFTAQQETTETIPPAAGGVSRMVVIARGEGELRGYLTPFRALKTRMTNRNL